MQGTLARPKGWNARKRSRCSVLIKPDLSLRQGWVRGLIAVLFFSNAGTGLQVAAQAWFVWETTHSSPYLGLLGLVQATPLFGIPFLGGMLADRFPRRSILLLTQTALASAAALMGMLELAAVLSPLLVLLLAGLAASVAALDNPVRQAYLPGMVGANERGRTVGLNALAYNAGMVMGPALAGILLPSVGAGWCFILNAVSYLFVVGWLWKGPEGPPLCPARAEFGSVIAYVRKAPPLVNLLVLIALVSLLGRSFPSVLPLLVNQRWGGGAGAYGAMAALPGLGALGAAGVATWLLGRDDSHHRIWLGGVLLGGAIVGLGLAPTLGPAGATLLLTGFAATGTMTLLNAGLQQKTPDEVRGRVLSLYTWLAAGMPALGGWLFGTLMAYVAPPIVLITAGSLLIALVLFIGFRFPCRHP